MSIEDTLKGLANDYWHKRERYDKGEVDIDVLTWSYGVYKSYVRNLDATNTPYDFSIKQYKDISKSYNKIYK